MHLLTVDFGVKYLMTDPVTNEWIVFLPNMPHLTKKIVTSFELSSSKTSKRNLMKGKVPINMQMIHEIWLKCNGASGQLQSTKLTSRHFDKNAYSCMNVKLATQLLSQSTVKMIRYAISGGSSVGSGGGGGGNGVCRSMPGMIVDIVPIAWMIIAVGSGGGGGISSGGGGGSGGV